MEENTTKPQAEVVVTPKVKENMTSENAPVSYYGDNNRSTDSALLAAMATKQPYEYDYAGMIGAGGICDLRHEVGEVKETVKDVEGNLQKSHADIRAEVIKEGQEGVTATKDAQSAVLSKIGDVFVKLGDVECKIIKENSDQTLYLTNQLSVIREQGIRGEYETKLSREQTIKELSAKFDHKAERAEDKLNALKEFGAEKYFALSKQLSDCCCELEKAIAGIENSGPGNS